jgi:para-nitrobenzyl esterase
VEILLGTAADEATVFFAFNPVMQSLIRDQVLVVITSLVGEQAARMYDSFVARRFGAAPARIFTDFITDQLFSSGGSDIATNAAQAYVYRFSRRPPDDDGTLGATHCADLPFLFNTFDSYPDAPMLGAVNDHDRDLGRALGGALAAFTATGSPNGPGLNAWGPWRPGPAPEVMQFM